MNKNRNQNPKGNPSSDFSPDDRFLCAYNFLQLFYHLCGKKGPAHVPSGFDSLDVQSLLKQEIDFQQLSEKTLDLYHAQALRGGHFPNTIRGLLDALEEQSLLSQKSAKL